MTKAGDRYPATVPDIRQRLADQKRRKAKDYAITLKQSEAVLKCLSQDADLLEDCAQLKVRITEVIWDVAWASAWRDLLKGLTGSRRQAKDAVKKARRRAPSSTVVDDDCHEKRSAVAHISSRASCKRSLAAGHIGQTQQPSLHRS
jgi:hypothetical protein